MDVREAAPAVVTGGSRGIGRAVVERLAAYGAPVVFGYATERARAEEVVEAVRAAGGSAWAVRADLAEPDGVDRLFAGADEHLGGRLGVLVNNAAVTGRTAFADASAEEFDRVLAVNARAALLAMQHAERRMAGGGRIVNISSVSTAWPAADEALYAASKGALEQLSRVASRALGPRGITVNTVSPGTTDTDLLRDAVPAEAREAVAGMTPLGRLGRPEDVAAVVAYLAGPDAAWVTGQNIRADGGLV
ncbi:SDR family oxidoreductase [Nocardiopsis composta]|uniref:3-oxoacyl-[acyl-carrier protein] reductase n=1 Tax=Nocardiopsis composta TaxID=157465 RepID=A0A7W8VGZ7_9ACTN|nr:SDR family oxidoreductase [Nocardiopsis composta]MBB5436077.1 3-oxoacyl-[acyl-carrier protein] reductase [Nocardiopsis composta]